MSKPTPRKPGDRTETRERILAEAAALFARRGFHGTSTRDIAAAVGVRQPSLFHHFPTKQDVLAELVDRDLKPALADIRRIRRLPGGPAERLYLYVRTEIRNLIAFPFDARGLYNDDVLEDDAFGPQRTCREDFHREVRGLVEEGIDAGDLRDVGAAFGQHAIHAMIMETVVDVAAGRVTDPGDRPTLVADFVLSGLLADAGSLDAVRSAADALPAT